EECLNEVDAKCICNGHCQSLCGVGRRWPAACVAPNHESLERVRPLPCPNEIGPIRDLDGLAIQGAFQSQVVDWFKSFDELPKDPDITCLGPLRPDSRKQRRHKSSQALAKLSELVRVERRFAWIWMPLQGFLKAPHGEQVCKRSSSAGLRFEDERRYGADHA